MKNPLADFKLHNAWDANNPGLPDINRYIYIAEVARLPLGLGTAQQRYETVVLDIPFF